MACNGQNALLHSANQIEFDLTIISLAPFRQADMVKNMAQDVYLYRKDRRWQKASKVIDVTLTSNQTAYASVTGVASTGIITITGATLADGQILTLSAKTGGSGVSLGVGYYIIEASGATSKIALTPGGSAVALGTDISAGSGIVSQPELNVWSSEYRDIFSSNIDGTFANSGGGLSGPAVYKEANSQNSVISYNGPGIASAATTVAAATTGLEAARIVVISVTNQSDEVAHEPLRQSFLKRTFWKFDRGASAAPRYLYAEYIQGDQILDNPPETV